MVLLYSYFESFSKVAVRSTSGSLRTRNCLAELAAARRAAEELLGARFAAARAAVARVEAECRGTRLDARGRFAIDVSVGACVSCIVSIFVIFSKISRIS